MMNNFDLLTNDDNVHSLLEPPIPAYSSTTVRRAFIVWLLSKMQPEFKQVCNFYHRLEEKERAMTPEERVKSRSRELRMYYKHPYIANFDPRKISAANMKQIKEIMSEVCVFQLEGFCELRADKFLKTRDVLRVNKMIRDYSKSHSISLRDMFHEFEDFTKKTDTKKSFNVIMGYTKNKFIKDELQLYISMHGIIECQLGFLDDDFDTKYKLKKGLEKTVDITKTSPAKKNSTTPIFDAQRNVVIYPNANSSLANEPKSNDVLNRTQRCSDLKKVASDNIM